MRWPPRATQAWFPGFAQAFVEFLEDVGTADESVADNAGTDIAGDDQLDFTIGDAIAVRANP